MASSEQSTEEISNTALLAALFRAAESVEMHLGDGESRRLTTLARQTIIDVLEKAS